MSRTILAASMLALCGCCPCGGGPGASTCSPSGLTEVAPDGSILSVTGPATMEHARTGERITVPAGETWRSVPSGWEKVR